MTPLEFFRLRRMALDDHLDTCRVCLYDDVEGPPPCGVVALLHIHLEDARKDLSPLEQLAVEGLD